MLHELYYNVDSPASFASAQTLHYHARQRDPNIKLKTVTDFLEAQDVYGIHKQAKIRKFSRNKVVATGLDTHWQADLCDMRTLKKWNYKHGYILTVVDVFSKYGFAEIVKKKSAKLVAEAFARIVKRSGRSPWFLMVDQGTEFRGAFHHYITEVLGITLHISNSPVIKAPNVERFNRILKNRMWKYFSHNKTKRYSDVLQKLVHACNERFSNPIQMRPSEVTYENETKVRQRLYGDEKQSKAVVYKYNVGDRVRLVNTQKVFQKGYKPRFSLKKYIITERLPRQPPVYRVRRDKQNSLRERRIFYKEELVKVV